MLNKIVCVYKEPIKNRVVIVDRGRGGKTRDTIPQVKIIIEARYEIRRLFRS